MAQLAIKGHATRGNEVIAILRMLGGKNKYNVDAIRGHHAYFIENGIISTLKINQIRPNQFIIFTLEEFLEKFPYKVGDKVKFNEYTDFYTISKMKWDTNLNDMIFQFTESSDNWWHKDGLQLCKKVEPMKRKIESLEILESHCADEVKIEFDPSKYDMVKKENGYYVVKKQPQYPKTREECCEMKKKIIFEFGAMSSRFRLQAENKFTAYAAMVLHFYSNPHLVALYEPEDLAKQDSWLMHTPVEPRLDEIFGGKGSFMKYLREHEEEIKEAIQNVEKIT